jgi:putative membrane protein
MVSLLEETARKETTASSKYIQQHLANERTYLAWVRTCITIVGLGFLSAGVIYRSYLNVKWEYQIAAFVGIGAVLLASFLLVFATMNYLRKQKDINTESFQPFRSIILFVLGGLLLTNMVLIFLLIIILYN